MTQSGVTFERKKGSKLVVVKANVKVFMLDGSCRVVWLVGVNDPLHHQLLLTGLLSSRLFLHPLASVAFFNAIFFNFTPIFFLFVALQNV